MMFGIMLYILFAARLCVLTVLGDHIVGYVIYNVVDYVRSSVVYYVRDYVCGVCYWLC